MTRGQVGVYNAIPTTIPDGYGAALALDNKGRQIVAGISSAIPLGAVSVNGSSGNVAAATATATLTATATTTVWITGFEITSSGSTAAAVVSPTVTGTITSTLTYTYVTTAGATLANNALIVQFTTPIPASAVNTNIVVSMASLGAGNTNATVVAHGYLL